MDKIVEFYNQLPSLQSLSIDNLTEAVQTSIFSVKTEMSTLTEPAELRFENPA